MCRSASPLTFARIDPPLRTARFHFGARAPQYWPVDRDLGVVRLATAVGADQRQRLAGLLQLIAPAVVDLPVDPTPIQTPLVGRIDDRITRELDDAVERNVQRLPVGVGVGVAKHVINLILILFVFLLRRLRELHLAHEPIVVLFELCKTPRA